MALLKSLYAVGMIDYCFMCHFDPEVSPALLQGRNLSQW